MTVKRLKKIFFSPTGTTSMIMNAVAAGMNPEELTDNNITFNSCPDSCAPDEAVLIGAPVYSGRLPRLFCERIDKLNGQNTPAIITVVYGNRHYDDALLELADMMTERGFRVISAAAFIGEHSFSSSEFPIAEGRPDKTDLKAAESWGQAVSKLLSDPDAGNTVLMIPGNRPYKELKAGTAVSPVTADSCSACMSCVKVCPSGAISSEDPFKTEAEKCIRCAACVKICPEGARAFQDAGMKKTIDFLFQNCRERREPELF